MKSPKSDHIFSAPTALKFAGHMHPGATATPPSSRSRTMRRRRARRPSSHSQHQRLEHRPRRPLPSTAREGVRARRGTDGAMYVRVHEAQLGERTQGRGGVCNSVASDPTKPMKTGGEPASEPDSEPSVHRKGQSYTLTATCGLQRDAGGRERRQSRASPRRGPRKRNENARGRSRCFCADGAVTDGTRVAWFGECGGASTGRRRSALACGDVVLSRCALQNHTNRPDSRSSCTVRVRAQRRTHAGVSRSVCASVRRGRMRGQTATCNTLGANTHEIVLGDQNIFRPDSVETRGRYAAGCRAMRRGVGEAARRGGRARARHLVRGWARRAMR